MHPNIFWAAYAAALMTLSLFISATHQEGLLQLTRTFLCFGAAPSLIGYSTRRGCWFRCSWKRLLPTVSCLPVTAAVFLAGTTAAYDFPAGETLSPVWMGIHLTLSFWSALLFWSPLLIPAPFLRRRTSMKKFAYLIVTGMLFYFYHQAAGYVQGEPVSITFMTTGTTALIMYLFYFIHAWAAAEEQTDRPTVKGQFHRFQRNKPS
ncbi:hypothetical protein [Halobacillus sp. Cin3]|uniref:hypothetical protein n=1 Tax=Halobacillus sp. Cin3 TaxID=2928441 RepID=UPI00248E1419|nr:hypothetical protein [Halobacillus sp. Cin3]